MATNEIDGPAVEAVLRRKIQVYKAQGNDAMAGLAQSIVDQGVEAVQSTIKVSLFASKNGSGNKKRLRDTPTTVERRLMDTPLRLTIEDYPVLLQRMADDPIYAADILHQMRRPKRGNATRHKISGRHAVREPMLNASVNSVANGLQYREPEYKDRVIKAGVYDTLVVKPTSSNTAKLERTSSFWGERTWKVYTLRYSKGYVLVTDKGSESRVFPTYGELKAAVRKSGWEIIR